MLLVGLLIGGLLGFAASYYASLLVEYRRRPILTFGIAAPADGSRGTDRWRFLNVEVLNETQPSWWVRYILLPGLIPRYTASACQAWISYRNEGGGEILPIDGRWSSTPEPLNPTAEGLLFDVSKVAGGQRENIPYDGPKAGRCALTIGLKFDGESDCYAFNSWSYAFPHWKNPDWKLPSGRYEVVVTVATSGYTFRSPIFILENPSSNNVDFVLSRPANPLKTE